MKRVMDYVVSIIGGSLWLWLFATALYTYIFIGE
jgi:hypothetical protein